MKCNYLYKCEGCSVVKSFEANTYTKTEHCKVCNGLQIHYKIYANNHYVYVKDVNGTFGGVCVVTEEDKKNDNSRESKEEG